MQDKQLEKFVLDADEPEAFEFVDVAARYPCLLVCDHASNRFPRCLRDLDLAAEIRESHLAWDIGSADLTRELSRRLGVPAILCNYSRLVIDCNRGLEDPTVFLRYSDGVPIARNVAIKPAERDWRIDNLYKPYHRAIEKRLAALTSEGRVAALFSLHSFTPVFDGMPRAWDSGVLWDADSRIAQPLLSGLRGLGNWKVGDNEPYSGRSAADFTVDYHGEAAGRAHAALEIRQDHLSSADGISYWADALAAILEPVLKSPDLYRRFQPTG